MRLAMQHRNRTNRPRSLRRFALVAASSAVLVTGGSGLLAVAFSNGPAGADNTLGGFTVTALGEAISAQYEQPNFPLPANPSLEFDEGYAATTDNFGPTGSALASTLYPGQVVANAGPELSLLVPGVPLPAAPTWPIQAVSNYPQTPNTAATDVPGLNMDAQSTTSGNTATATIGDDAATAGSNGADPTQQAPTGTGNPLAGSSGLLGIGVLSASSSSQAPTTTATATATATVGGISMLGGFISIGSITSTATASSDGTTGKVTGTTQVQNVSIAGEQISITANGISALNSKSLGALPISALNTLLKELGITIAVTNPTDKVSGASASRELDGLEISVNLDTLDTAANKFASLLPAKIISQLPVAIPNQQLITLYLGRVQVSSTASPNFAANSGSTGAGTSAAPPSTGAASAGNTGSGFTGNTGAGTGGTFAGNTGSGLGSTPAGTSPGTGTSPTVSPQTSTVGATFKGIGASLILLGLLAAAALAYLYKRADDLTDALGTTCSEGDPLMERFTVTPDELNDFGGFG
jgi:hypothetical protein